MILLTLNEQEEKVIDKIISAITDYIQFEPTQVAPASVLSFSGLSTLVFLASNPGIVLTRSQIFEAVWNMDSDSCHSSVGNVICNLRKKIEPDSKNPTYIKTVLGDGLSPFVTQCSVVYGCPHGQV